MMRCAALGAVLCLIVACAGTPPPPPEALRAPQEYVIGPEDVLRVEVWKEESLSGELTVRPDGMISLPLVGDVRAAGLTPTQLAGELEKRLKEYVALPKVTVTVLQPNLKIYIVGEVRRPGEYQLHRSVTLLQAIAMAGGFTEWASRKITILRREDGREVRIQVDYDRIVAERDPLPDIPLRRDDTLVVR